MSPPHNETSPPDLRPNRPGRSQRRAGPPEGGGLGWRWWLLFAVLSFLFWGARPLWDSSEARYGEVSRLMLVRGDWLVPRLAGREHLTKPPLTYWLTALGLRLFGVNAWGARFFSSAAFFGTILCVASLAGLWRFSPAQQRLAALVFATSVFPFAAGHTLTADVFLVFWETLGIVALWKAWKADSPARLWRVTFWMAFALAFLTKGPAGWLPLAAVLIFQRVWHGEPARPCLGSRPRFIAFLAVSFSWYLILIAMRRDLIVYFLKEELLDRIFTTHHERYKPFWIYVPILAGGVFPWIFLWPGLVRRTCARLRQGWARLAPWQAFCLVWVGVPFTVFTFAESRMPLYVLPLFVPISLALGRSGTDSAMHWYRRHPRLAWGLAALWLAVLIAIQTAPEGLPSIRSHRALARELARVEAHPPRPTRYFFLFGINPHSVSFYSGLNFEFPPAEGDNAKEWRALDQTLRQEGIRGVYLLKRSKLGGGLSGQVVTLASDDEMAAVEMIPR